MKDNFKNILASSCGYGYYYVKEIKGGDVKVVPILTAEQARGAAGKITSSVWLNMLVQKQK